MSAKTWEANAIEVRLERARASDEFKERLEFVIDNVAVIIKGADVSRMKELGGFSHLIALVIGPQPEPCVNSIGMPTSDSWWIYNALCAESLYIRNAAVAKNAGTA